MDSPTKGSDCDAALVEKTLEAIRITCETSPLEVSDPNFVLEVIARNGSEDDILRIARLTASAAATEAREAAERATASSVRPPALILPYRDGDDPDGASSVLALGALIPPAVADDLLDRPARDELGRPWRREQTMRLLTHEFVHLTQQEDTLPTGDVPYGDGADAALLEGLTECLACAGRGVSPDGNHYLRPCDVVRWLLPYTDDALDCARSLNRATVASRIGVLAVALDVEAERLRAALDLSSWETWPPTDGALAALHHDLCRRDGLRDPWSTATALGAGQAGTG